MISLLISSPQSIMERNWFEWWRDMEGRDKRENTEKNHAKRITISLFFSLDSLSLFLSIISCTMLLYLVVYLVMCYLSNKWRIIIWWCYVLSQWECVYLCAIPQKQAHCKSIISRLSEKGYAHKNRYNITTNALSSRFDGRGWGGGEVKKKKSDKFILITEKFLSFFLLLSEQLCAEYKKLMLIKFLLTSRSLHALYLHTYFLMRHEGWGGWKKSINIHDLALFAP